MALVDNFQDFIKYHAEAAGMTREEYMAVLMSEAKKKPGPDPYHRGLEDDEVEDKEDQIKKQADMDDDDPDAYKEMPGDKDAREKGEVKTSKATKSYKKLYGEDLDEGTMSDIHQMAGEVKSEEEFIKKFFKEYGAKIKKTKDSEEWAKSLYNDMSESVKESQAHDEMAYGQLERIIDYATMLRKRYDNGFTFDPWMHGKITKAKSYLNSVFDALDGGDGVVEGKVNETAMGYDAMTGLFYMEGVPFTQQRLEQVLNWLKGTTVKAGKTLPKQFTYKPAIEVEDSVSGNEITVDTDKIDYLKFILKKFKGKLANDGEFNEFDESKVEETQKMTKKQWKHIKKFNKHITDNGDKFVMSYDDRIGTFLEPVEIVDENEVSEAFKFGKKNQYSIDDVNEAYGFWGTLEVGGFKRREIEDCWHSAMAWLTESYRFSDAGALYYLNAKAGRWIADQVIEQKGNKDVVDVLEDYATDAEWKKWSKEYNKYAQEEMMQEATNPVNEEDDTEQKSTDRGPLDDDKIETALKKKAEDTGVPIGIIRAVMRRGLAAWKSGHRPGANQQQWGYARVNAFLTKGEGTWGKADKDLAKEVRDGGHDKKLKKA
jgi:hypothetical protein